jgi:hypothetical protein
MRSGLPIKYSNASLANQPPQLRLNPAPVKRTCITATLSKPSASKYRSGGARGASHGGNAAVVAVGQFLQRSALRAATGGLFLL